MRRTSKSLESEGHQAAIFFPIQQSDARISEKMLKNQSVNFHLSELQPPCTITPSTLSASTECLQEPFKSLVLWTTLLKNICQILYRKQNNFIRKHDIEPVNKPATRGITLQYYKRLCHPTAESFNSFEQKNF